MANKLLVFNKKQYKKLKQQFEAEEKEIVTITHFLDSNKVSELTDDVVMDISSIAGLFELNNGMQFQFEQLFDLFPEDMQFIVQEKYREEVEFYLRHCFDDIQIVDIEVEENDLDKDIDEIKEIKHVTKRIIDLDDKELKEFLGYVDEKLYGHAKFKDEFKDSVNSFRIFNKIGEHKILSLFLMGDSGVGKTEVARTIHKALKSNKKLAKINFGNYSSQDALNSLIGSPLGYIGSDGGELLKRVLESDVGVILIDEFEKASTAVFNYFLDVLENGKITNTRAEEYDVSGFIIIFTSNISKESFESKISPELRSRFDYVGEFNLLTDEDKVKFVKFRFGEIIKKYQMHTQIQLPSDAHSKLVELVKVSKYKNMRHLNKKIKDTFVNYIEDCVEK